MAESHENTFIHTSLSEPPASKDFDKSVPMVAQETPQGSRAPEHETPGRPEQVPVEEESSDEEESEDLNEEGDPRNDTANLNKEGLKCHQCNEVFSQRSQYLTHQRMHNMSRPYQCDFEGCNLRFATKSSLKRHSRTHTGEKPFRCYFSGCNKSFVQPSHLTIHVRTHTGEKPYECDHPSCSLRFATRSDLKMHYRTHTGERPYACAEIGCNKRFARLSDLRTHEFVHTGEKPFKCTYKDCGKSFSKSSDLSKHVRTHTGERPYICTVPNCGKRYAQRSNLVTHLKTHTRSKRGAQRLSPSEVKQYIFHTGKHRTQRNQMLASATGLASLPAAEVAKAFRSGGPEEVSVFQRMPSASNQTQMVTNDRAPGFGAPPGAAHFATPENIRSAPANLEVIKGEMALTDKTAPMLDNSVEQFQRRCLDVQKAVNSSCDAANTHKVSIEGAGSAFKTNTRSRTPGRRPRTSIALKYEDTIDGVLLSLNAYRHRNVHGSPAFSALKAMIAEQKQQKRIDMENGSANPNTAQVHGAGGGFELPFPKPVPYQNSAWPAPEMHAQCWMYDNSGNTTYGLPMTMAMPMGALTIKSANVWQATLAQRE